eukprot:1140840-Prymnesium_polylepis.1
MAGWPEGARVGTGCAATEYSNGWLGRNFGQEKNHFTVHGFFTRHRSLGPGRPAVTVRPVGGWRRGCACA